MVKTAKKTILFYSVIAGLLFISISTKAQIKEYKLKGGLNFNYILPMNEFEFMKKVKFTYVAKGFLRWKLSDLVGLQVGAGYGSYAGHDPDDTYFRTQLIPADLRLIISPFNLKKVNPFLYAGGGILSYKVTDKPYRNRTVNPTQEEVKEDGITGIIPLGIGIEFMTSKSFSLEFNAGYTYSFTDNLNFFKATDSPTDGWIDIGASAVWVLNSGDPDRDKDGLLNDVEEKYGTDPDNPDTDGDKLNDGDEVNKYKTNPLNTDTDSEGLGDYDEVKKYQTDPTKPDSDMDSLSDYDEIITYNTDPLDADTDKDMLKDGEEVATYKTDPNKADTDGDGLTDGEEVSSYKTDPLKIDTDADELNDFEEIKTYNTNPRKPDTDGGTIADGIEVHRGTDPLDPTDDVIRIEVPIVLEGVTFATSSAELTKSSETVLEKVLTTLHGHKDIVVEIRGYTDATGSRSYNEKLSKRRAESVRNWLVNKGINSDRLIAKGFGPDNPIASNKTKEGRKKNRRIEFVRIK